MSQTNDDGRHQGQPLSFRAEFTSGRPATIRSPVAGCSVSTALSGRANPGAKGSPHGQGNCCPVLGLLPDGLRPRFLGRLSRLLRGIGLHVVQVLQAPDTGSIAMEVRSTTNSSLGSTTPVQGDRHGRRGIFTGCALRRCAASGRGRPACGRGVHRRSNRRLAPPLPANAPRVRSAHPAGVPKRNCRSRKALRSPNTQHLERRPRQRPVPLGNSAEPHSRRSAIPPN